MATILIITDDASVSSFLYERLTGVGYNIDIVQSGNYDSSLKHITQYDYIMIQQSRGLAICKYIRHLVGDSIPIYVLTATSSTELIIKGIEAGATDFISIALPFGDILSHIQRNDIAK